MHISVPCFGRAGAVYFWAQVWYNALKYKIERFFMGILKLIPGITLVVEICIGLV